MDFYIPGYDQEVEGLKQKLLSSMPLRDRISKLEHKVEKEGYSDQSAKKIAAAAGIAKYGKAGMEAKAKAGKK